LRSQGTVCANSPRSRSDNARATHLHTGAVCDVFVQLPHLMKVVQVRFPFLGTCGATLARSSRILNELITCCPPRISQGADVAAGMPPDEFITRWHVLRRFHGPDRDVADLDVAETPVSGTHLPCVWAAHVRLSAWATGIHVRAWLHGRRAS
jgi:hypothetical protein